MTFYDNVDWIGFLVENVIRKCVSLTVTECSGCIDGMKSDILHLHHQLSLLDKVQIHFEKARWEVLISLHTLYKTLNQSYLIVPILRRIRLYTAILVDPFW